MLFCLLQAKKIRKVPGPKPEHCVLYCVEVLFLWNALSQCHKDDVAQMADGTLLLFHILYFD